MLIFIYLFGSRVDNAKRGGDIDLIITSEKLNNAHKRGLFLDIELIRQVKDIRNEIVHEYLDDALQSVFVDVLNTAPDLIEIGRKTLQYSRRYIHV